MAVFSRLTLLIITVLTPQNNAYSANKALSMPKGATISIQSPKNNAIVPSQFKIQLASRMVAIMPAGVPHTDSGHYHILIDSGTNIEMSPGKTPATKSQTRLDKGERETIINLPPGRHRLQAVLVDHLHRAHQPPLSSEIIEITVLAPITNKKKAK